MRIMNNIASLNAWKNLTLTDRAMNRSLERLSSGLRITRAADDAAGLAISEKMRSQLRGVNQAVRNASDGISLIQTAEGALQEVHSILQRMRELSVQSASDTLTDTDRAELQKEVNNLKIEIDRIGESTEFNTKKLLNGNVSEATTAQGTIMKSVELNRGNTASLTADDNVLATNWDTAQNTSFTVSLNGGETTKTLSLAGNLADAAATRDAMQALIDADADLVGKVAVSLDGDQLVFNRLQTGADKDLEISAVQTSVRSSGVQAGFDFSANGANFDLSVGGTTANIALNQNNATAEDVRAEIATRIAASALNGMVEVSLDATDRLVFTTTEAHAAKTIEIANKAGPGAASLEVDVAVTQNAMTRLGLVDGTAADNSVAAAGATGSAPVTADDFVLTLFDDVSNPFNLSVGNEVQIEGIVNGEKLTGTFTINSDSTMADLLAQVQSVLGTDNIQSVSLSAEGRIAVESRAGTAFAASDIKLSITDKNLFNNKLSAFEETQVAQDDRTDAALNFHIGANSGQGMKVGIADMRKQALGIQSVDVGTHQGASIAITLIDRAMNQVSAERANLGAVQNRLEHTINNLNTQAENLSAAESRIRDADMAFEMSIFTRNQILIQAGTAMMAQANVKTQAVLQLLG